MYEDRRRTPAGKGSPESEGARPLPSDPSALLFTSEAAFLLGLSPRTLETLRLKGGGPPYISVTKKAVRYRRSDLDQWIESRCRKSTSDALQ